MKGALGANNFEKRSEKAFVAALTVFEIELATHSQPNIVLSGIVGFPTSYGLGC